MAADWSQLDLNFLEIIGKKLNLYPDYVSFRSVCHWWRSSLPLKPKHITEQFPCLILPPESQDDPNQTHLRGLLNIFLGEVNPIELPQLSDKFIRGSSHGWIVTVGKEPSIYLVNPVTGAQIQLPPITTFPDVLEYHADRVGQEYLVRETGDKNTHYNFTLSSELVRNFFIKKVFLSSSPSTNNYIAMAIYDEIPYLALSKQPRDNGWTKVVTENLVSFQDVILYKEKFYALDSNAGLHVIVDVGSDSPEAVKIASPPSEFRSARRLYLVESSGDLLMVAREGRKVYHPYSYNTTKFRVYKLYLDRTCTQGNWSKQLGTLRDRVLFLGYNQSVSFPSRNFPGCKGDCIYFTDDYHEGQVEGEVGGADLGVFNYKNKTFEKIPGYEPHSKFLCPAPVWVFPNA